METIVAWVSVFASALLAVACLMLYVDGKGQRRALRVAQEALTALQRQVIAQDVAIGQMSRAIALLVPPDNRPTTSHKPVVGLSRPFLPSPDQAAAARTAYAEAQAWPPVDTTGDRAAPFQGSESAEAIRARFEAEAEARSQARPSRTADAFRRRRSPSSPTLISAGVEAKRDTLTPTEPGAQEAGQNAHHCHTARCFQAGQDITACECQCDGCALVVRLLVEARSEIIGEDW